MWGAAAVRIKWPNMVRPENVPFCFIHEPLCLYSIFDLYDKTFDKYNDPAFADLNYCDTQQPRINHHYAHEIFIKKFLNILYSLCPRRSRDQFEINSGQVL